MEKTYEFRELNYDDMFIMFEIVRKIGIREFADCLSGTEAKAALAKMFAAKTTDAEEKPEAGATDAEVVQLGISVMPAIAETLLKNIGKCQDDVARLLAGVANMKEKDIHRMSMVTVAAMILDFVKKPEFKDFIKVVSESFK